MSSCCQASRYAWCVHTDARVPSVLMYIAAAAAAAVTAAQVACMQQWWPFILFLELDANANWLLRCAKSRLPYSLLFTAA